MISESCRGNYRGNVRARHQTITHHPLLHPAVEAVVIIIVIAIDVVIVIIIIIVIAIAIVSVKAVMAIIVNMFISHMVCQWLSVTI